LRCRSWVACRKVPAASAPPSIFLQGFKAEGTAAGRGPRRAVATCSEEQRPGCSMEDGRRQRQRRWEPQALVPACRGALVPALGGAPSRVLGGATPDVALRRKETGRGPRLRVSSSPSREDGWLHRALGVERHRRRLTEEHRREPFR
jgi:hypothetical protein